MLFKDKNVVELGAGAGLSGVVAANYAKHSVLTDNNDVVMKLLSMNEKLCNKSNLFVKKFAWGSDSLKDLQITNVQNKTIDFSVEPVDILMGADVIFWPESLIPLMLTIKETLDLNKDCLVLISFCSRSKSVDDRFYQKLEEYKLSKEVLFEDGNRYLFKIAYA